MAIGFHKAFTWLNQFDTSHLRSFSESKLQELDDPSIPEYGFNQLRSMLNNPSDLHLLSGLEYAEVLVNCARIELRRGEIRSGSRSLEQAQMSYQESGGQNHRLAMVGWMLGAVLWQLQEPFSAYDHWVTSRGIFLELAELAVRKRDAIKSRWYSERVEDMTVDLSGTAPQSYTWLHYFDPSNLSKVSGLLSEYRGPDDRLRCVSSVPDPLDPLQQVLEQMDDLVRNNQGYATVVDMANRLQAVSSFRANHLQHPDVLVEGGLAACLMNMFPAAVEFLRRAVSEYKPLSHQQAVAGWMLGIAAWNVPEDEMMALEAWRRSIETIERLSREADQRNRQQQWQWYRELLIVLKRALQEKIEHHFGKSIPI